jgi:hypothetical protein
MRNKSKTIITAAVAGLVAMGLLGVLGLAHGPDWVVGMRADTFERRAEEALAEGRWAAAARFGAAAYYLDGSRSKAALLTARANLRQRSPLTVDWWRRGLDHPEQPVEELRELIGLLLESGANEESLPFLNRLLLEDDGVETRAIWMRAMRAMKRYGAALAISEDLIGRAGATWEAHRDTIELRSVLLGENGQEAARGYLADLMAEGGDSGREAARVLLRMGGGSTEDRLAVARQLLEMAALPTDELAAYCVLEAAGEVESGTTHDSFRRLLAEAEGEGLTRLALMAIRLEAAAWVVESLDFSEYTARGGQMEVYFEACLKGGRETVLLELTEEVGSTPVGSRARALLTYYRGMGQLGLGQAMEARESFVLAAEIADPAEVPILEAKLYAIAGWEALQVLYRRLLTDQPNHLPYRQKALMVAYYQADQARLEALLEDLDPEALEPYPVALAFTLYLRLLIHGWTHEDHMHLEALMARYPETFDFRLLLGFSHLLAGEPTFASGFTAQMPGLDPSAPRYLRVCAGLLGASGEAFLSSAERLELLPRERHLLALSEARRQGS